jgi:hypothetical protein
LVRNNKTGNQEESPLTYEDHRQLVVILGKAAQSAMDSGNERLAKIYLDAARAAMRELGVVLDQIERRLERKQN